VIEFDQNILPYNTPLPPTSPPSVLAGKTADKKSPLISIKFYLRGDLKDFFSTSHNYPSEIV
jgi:hypothetical protein